MRKRTGDWRDLLWAYSLAIDAKKIYVGFIATLYTVLIMVVACVVYAWLAGTALLPAFAGSLVTLGEPGGSGALLGYFVRGRGLEMLGLLLPLLNPFYSGQPIHFILSVLFYAALVWVWSGAGGAIARLSALEYARDDLPTLVEARDMVKDKRMSYFFAPLWPLIGIVALTILNALGGLVASIPYLGRLLLIFPGFPLLVATTVVIVFLAVFGVLSFGMMMPAISVGGKDSFEGWSCSFSYVLWGFGRLVCYTVLAGVIGAVVAVTAWGLSELVIYVIYQTVNIGFLSGTPWISYEHATEGGLAVALYTIPWQEGAFASVCSTITVALLLALRVLPAACVFAYFFTANTIIFLLMRKHVDNVEIEEVYEEVEEEVQGEEAAAPVSEEPAAQVPEAPAEEAAPEEETAPAEEQPEEQKEQEPEKKQEEESEEGEEGA